MGIAMRMNGLAPPEVPLSEIDLGSAEFWLEDDDVRDAAFATLRREAPISFWAEPPAPGFEQGPGHWAVTKLDDVHFASRHPDIYSSYPNIGINDLPTEVAEFFGSMIALDDPRHQRLRNIVSRASSRPGSSPVSRVNRCVTAHVGSSTR
jgi:cytochrome P450